MNRAPVGILDSGFGGLSVYAAVKKLLPGESTVFAADCAGAPWGDRSDEYILERLEGLVGFLLSRNVKAIVLACNTATAVGAAVLRARLSIPVIGIEPAVLPGCRETKTKVIGVLATTKTIRSAKYRHLRTLAPADVKVLDQPCPGLMDCVEKGAFHAPETVELARRYVAPLVKEHADRLVLGCTHYPFLSDVLHEVAGPGVDSWSAASRRTTRSRTASRPSTAFSSRAQTSAGRRSFGFLPERTRVSRRSAAIFRRAP